MDGHVGSIVSVSKHIAARFPYRQVPSAEQITSQLDWPSCSQAAPGAEAHPGTTRGQGEREGVGHESDYPG
jgi:hypothetical protein